MCAPALLSRFCSGLNATSYDEFLDRFRIRVPPRFNYAWSVLAPLARSMPHRRALVWCDDAGNSRVFSFADLHRESSRAACMLKRHGVRKGDRVLLMLRSRYEFWLCLLACHKLEAVAIPATHLLTAEDIAYRLARACVRTVVCDGRNPSLPAAVETAEASGTMSLTARILAGGTRAGWISYDQAVASENAELQPPPAARLTPSGTPMLLYFTSGTTGLPKMVQHDFGYPLGHIPTAVFWQQVVDGGLHYTVADTGWAKAAWGKGYGQWLGGSAVFVYDYERFSPTRMLERAIEYGVTTFCAPPTVYRYLVKQDLGQFDLSRFRHCVVAGEPLSPETYAAFRQATGLSLREGYGQTELGLTVAAWPWLEPRPGSMGKAAPQTALELLDEDGRPVQPGTVGELVINTSEEAPPAMFNGYCDDRPLTRRVWHDGRYHTGDLARRDQDGYLWFVGRADDLIKSSGYRIGPFEIENVLRQHPDVLECAVTGVPDPARGQIVKATIVPTEGTVADERLRHEFLIHVRRHTAPYKCPRIVEFAENLPKTISGKIRHAAIRDAARPPATG